jgi:hypothetical protein
MGNKRNVRKSYSNRTSYIDKKKQIISENIYCSPENMEFPAGTS